MNTAKQMYDECTRSRSLCVFILGEEPVCKQNTCTGTRVGFNHVENGMTDCFHLLCTKRCEDAVIDCVVEEQHFCRFNKD